MKEMMIFKAILLSQCVLHIIGRNARGEESEGPLSLDRSWETQHFIKGDSLVEQESENHFSALRERRDTTKPKDEEILMSGSTSDIDECGKEDNQCSQNALCNNTVGSFECTCKETYYGDGKVCTELRSDYSSKNVYTKPGDSAVLVCSLNETVQWRKDGKLVINNDKRKISKNVLVITSNDDEDYGEYFCELRNYQGKGLKMSLLKINENENGNDNSTKFLIPFVIVLVLLVVALVVIGYLLFRRKPKSETTIKRNPTASDNRYGKSNEIFMHDMVGSVSNVEVNPEPEYATYKPPTTIDDENTYQSLININKSPETEEDPNDAYEYVPPARKD